MGIEHQEDELKIQVQAFLDNLESINNDVGQLPQLEKSLETWRATFVTQAQTPDLLNDILRIGTNNSLRFDTFSPGAEMNEGLYVKIPIKIVIKGTYEQVANFISQVANMTSIVVIGNFSMAKRRANGILGGNRHGCWHADSECGLECLSLCWEIIHEKALLLRVIAALGCLAAPLICLR